MASLFSSFMIVVDAALGEIITTCSKMEWLLKHGEQALRPSKRSTPLVLMHKSSKVYYEPLGVVCAIVSWNYRTAVSYAFSRVVLTDLYSVSQCVISHSRCTIFREQHCCQVFGERCLVNYVVHWGCQSLFTCMWVGSRVSPGGGLSHNLLAFLDRTSCIDRPYATYFPYSLNAY